MKYYIVYEFFPNYFLSFRACCRTYKINSMHQTTFRNMQSISLCMQTSLASRPLSKMLMLMKTSIQVNNSLNIYSSLYQMQKNVTNRPVGRSKVRGKIHLLIRSSPRLMLEKCWFLHKKFLLLSFKMYCLRRWQTAVQ